MPCDRSRIYSVALSRVRLIDYGLWFAVMADTVVLHLTGHLKQIPSFRSGLEACWASVNIIEACVYKTTGVKQYSLWYPKLRLRIVAYSCALDWRDRTLRTAV